jgi:hypothetical protein
MFKSAWVIHESPLRCLAVGAKGPKGWVKLLRISNRIGFVRLSFDQYDLYPSCFPFAFQLGFSLAAITHNTAETAH